MYILPSQSTICMISTAFIHIYSKWEWSSQLFIPLSRIRKFNLSCEDTLNQALCKYIKRFVYLQNEHWKSQVGKDLGRSQVVLKLGYEIRFCCSGLYPVASWKSPEDIKCTVHSVLDNLFCYLALFQGRSLLWFISSLTFFCFSLCPLSLVFLPCTADSWQSLALSLYN